MRFSSRPVSSPGRTDNPPLLMRFLRTNAGSKSRSRSRSRSRKPIFFRRKNAAETQEPTSPKVTCMGQVRIKRSKKPKPGSGRVVGGATERRCGWVKNAFSCHPFSGKLKTTCFSPVWRKWKSFSNVSFSRKSEKRSSSSRSEPIFGRSTVEPEEIRREECREEEEANSDKSFAVTPPTNAFLLTRCRSTPYRSPSFADSFLEEEDQRETTEPRLQRHDYDVIVSVSGESTMSVTKAERLEDSRRESAASEEAKRSMGSPRRQCRVLRRCNSEPSRIGEKLVHQNQRRNCLYLLHPLRVSLMTPKFRIWKRKALPLKASTGDDFISDFGMEGFEVNRLPSRLFRTDHYPIRRLNVYFRPNLLSFVHSKLEGTEESEVLKSSRLHVALCGCFSTYL